MFTKEQEARHVKKEIETKEAHVASVETKDKKVSRPIGLNTVALLKVCSNNFQIGPHRV